MRDFIRLSLVVFALFPIAVYSQSIDTARVSLSDSALADLKKLEQDSNLTTTRIRSVARNYLMQNTPEDALAILQFGVETFPDSTDVLDDYGETLIHIGRLEAGLSVYQKLFKRDPGWTKAHGAIASIYNFKGAYNKARSFLREILKSPDINVKKDAYASLAASFLYEAKWDSAITAMRERLKLTESSADVEKDLLDHPYWDLHLIGNILAEAGRFDDAEKVYQEAFETTKGAHLPERALKWITSDMQYFRVYLSIKRLALERAATGADALIPANRNGGGSLAARIKILQGNPAEARTVLNQYCRDGYYKDFVMAMAYEKQGNREEAERLYRRVVSFNKIGNRFWQHEYALIRFAAAKSLEKLRLNKI